MLIVGLGRTIVVGYAVWFLILKREELDAMQYRRKTIRKFRTAAHSRSKF